MPQEIKKINGRYVVVGSQTSSDRAPAPTVPRPSGRGSGSGRSTGRGGGSGRARPGGGRPRRRSWWEQLQNDIAYELLNRPSSVPAVQAVRSIVRPVLAVNQTINRYNPATQLLNTHSRAATTLGQQALLGVVGAGDNAVRMGYSAIQRVSGRPSADPTSGQFGSDLDRAVDHAYQFLGATPPSQMSQDERQFDSIRRSVALNALLVPVSPGFGALRATTWAGGLFRGSASFAVNEALSTLLDDNTGGNVINAINGLTGARLPGAVAVGKDDMVDSALKSLAPNGMTSLAVGGAFAGAGALGSLGSSAFSHIRRNTRAQRAIDQEEIERAMQEAVGLLEKDEAGSYNLTPAARPGAAAPAPAPAAAPAPEQTPAQAFAEANAAMEARLGGQQPAAAASPPDPAAPSAVTPAPTAREIPTSEMEPGGTVRNPDQPLPEADPGQDPWHYDPDLPETTAVGKALKELSDSELRVVQQGAGMPVVDRVNQVLEARGQIQPPPSTDAGLVFAPTGNLAEDYLANVSGKLRAREDWELRPLFDPQVNPGLWQRAQALTGVDDPSQLSKVDMIELLGPGAEQTPIVNRMMGAQMLPTADVKAAPAVFQYKGGVNEQGEQIGNSLAGVERWDPEAENLIQVWRDGAGEIGPAGQVYVVNGHNRLAAAQRLGIPSLRVEYLDAPTAAEARLQGAIANVSDGKGTVFDAAKLAREYGITDAAQLKKLGKPGASGFWKDGMALGRLPEDIFTAAVNEQIPLRRAVIIGESGVDEETMRSAYRYLVQQGPDNVKEGTLREMLAMAGRSPSASSTDQPDLLTGTEWGQSFNEGLLAKANLASSVRQLLSREKKLFATVGRQSGQIERVGQVDAAAARGISGDASRALTIFDQLKYEDGPVSQLLNEGTQRVLAGESPDAVAKGIKNRLAAAIQEAMGKEVAPATDVVQEDMFAAGARATEAPAEQGPLPDMTPEERTAAETDLLFEAARNGEVKPPTAPIPQLPAPAQVRLEDVDLTQPITPGSPAAQALADETRLAVEHARMDAQMGWLQEQAARDAAGYENLTFDQKRDLGAFDVINPEVLPPERGPSLADAFAEQARQLAESDARLYRNAGERISNIRRGLDELDAAITADAPIGEIPAATMPPANTLAGKTARKELADLEERIRFSRDERLPSARAHGRTDLVQQLEAAIPKWEKQLADLQAQYGIKPAPLAPAPVRPEPLRLTTPAQQPDFLLPRDLNKSTPRYGRATINFQSDLDRAAYVLANDAVKPSKAADKFRQVVREAGLNLDDVIAHGKRVKAALKQAAGGGAAPQGAMQIDLPAQPWRGGGQIDEMALDGWDPADTMPFDAKANRLERQIEALKIIRQVAGPDVQVRFEDEYLKKIKGAEWGGDGKATTLQGGFYRLSEDLIMLRGVIQGSDRKLRESAFHESFHRLQYLALGEKEAKILDSDWARIKVAVGSNHITGSPSTGRPIAYSESQAVAFQHYAEARREGKDPVVAMLGGYEPSTPTIQKAIIRVVAAFDRVADIIEKLFNRFANGTLDSTRGIFERARRGDLINQSEYAFEQPGSGLDMMVSSGGWRQRSWDQQPIAPLTKAGIQRLDTQIAANNKAMDDIRLKAQQEGC